MNVQPDSWRRFTDPFGWVDQVIDGRFRVECAVGEGGQGIVYRGTHLSLGESIAIKCLRLPGQIDEEQRNRLIEAFREEARLAHRLARQTAGIVQVLDVGAAVSPSGVWTPYLVMEWLTGETLRDELARRESDGSRPRSLAEAVELLAPAAEALDVSHANHVAHLDVKPGNLFLTRSAARPTMKLVDFGIAKRLTESDAFDAWSLKDASVRAFTPGYAAPEQFSPRFGPTGPWTDVYALALVLLETVTGRKVFDATDVFGVYDATTNVRTRPDFRGLGVAAGDAEEHVLRRALEIAPHRRFRRAGDFWNALRAALRGEPLSLPDVELPPTRDEAGGARRDDGRGPERETGTLRSQEQRRAAVTVASEVAGPRAASGAAPDSDLRGTGQHRICTILFVHFGDGGDLTTAFGAEDAAELIDRYQNAAREQIEAHGGVADIAASDRATGLFGLERASVGHAERAVGAALRILECVRRIRPPRSVGTVPVRARIGVHTGRAFVRLVDRGAGESLAVLGHALTVAARLQAIAPDGAVLVGRDTWRHVCGQFEAKPVTVVAPDKGRQLLGYRVSGRASARRALVPAEFHGVPVRVLGRESELARALEAFDLARSERSVRLVTVVAEAGLGRSCLLSEIAKTLADSSTLVLAAHATPLQREGPYGLVAALLRDCFHVHEDDPADVASQKIARGLDALAREATDSDSARSSYRPLAAIDTSEIVAQLVPLLVSSDAALSSSPLTPDERGDRVKARIAGALAALLAALGRPLALLCDDVHWADDASLDLIVELLVRSTDTPLLVLCTARPELFERRPLWGEGRSAHLRLDLGPLSPRSLEEMARDRLHRVPALSPEVVRRLVEHAEGSPLVLDETLRLLVDTGIIDTRDPARWVAPPEHFAALTLPTSVQGLVQARIDRLGTAERTALLYAAVGGRTFWDGLVVAFALDDAGAAPERLSSGDDVEPEALRTAILRSLTELRRKGFVQAREKSTFPDEREYVFAQSSLQLVAYDTLSVKVRRRLHQRAALWLAERAGGDAGAARVAQHFEQSGELARAYEAYARAGRHASALGHSAEALRCFERAVRIDGWSSRADDRSPAETFESLPVTDELRVASWRERFALRVDLGDALRRSGRLDDAERNYEQARGRILREERRRGSPLDPKEILVAEARVDYRQALVEQQRGGLERAQALVERAIERAHEGGAGATGVMWALCGEIHRRRRRLAACVDACRRGLRACRDTTVRDSAWHEAVCRLLNTLGSACYVAGRRSRAERLYLQASRFADTAGDPYQASVCQNNVAAVRFAAGDTAGAHASFVRALKLAERAGDLAVTATALGNLAEVELCRGEPLRARDYAREAIRLGERLELWGDLPDSYRNLAEASCSLGDAETAVDAAQRALELTAREAGRMYLPGVLLTVARVAAESRGRAPGSAVLETELRRRLEATDSDVAEVAERCHAILAGG